eukprot:6575274-Alexandrium_andersonii.AAC.1
MAVVPPTPEAWAAGVEALAFVGEVRARDLLHSDRLTRPPPLGDEDRLQRLVQPQDILGGAVGLEHVVEGVSAVVRRHPETVGLALDEDSALAVSVQGDQHVLRSGHREKVRRVGPSWEDVLLQEVRCGCMSRAGGQSQGRVRRAKCREAVAEQGGDGDCILG